MDSALDQPTLRDRLGGRWSVSWQAVAITTPLAILTLVVWSRSAREALIWIGIGLVAMGAVATWTYLMHRTLFHDRETRAVHPVIVVASSIIAASIFVAVAYQIGTVAGVSDSTRPVPNPIPTLIFASGWGVALVLILESQWRFRKQRAELIDQAVQQKLAGLQEVEVLDQIRVTLQHEIDDALTESRHRIEAQIDALQVQEQFSASRIADELRIAADDSVRPLSHRLEQQSRQAHPTPGIFTVLANIARFQPFRPFAVSIIYILTAAATEVRVNGAALGLGIVLLTVAFIFATMSLINSAMRRWPDRHTALFIGGIAFVQLPTIALAPLKSTVTGIPSRPADMIATVVLGTIIIVTTSAFGAWNRSRVRVIEEFALEVNNDRIQALAQGAALAEVARQAAVVLHGTTQSRLRACAAAVDMATSSGDVAEMNRALMQARAILDEPLSALDRKDRASLAELMETTRRQWAGLVAVTIRIEPASATVSGSDARRIADIVEEGIANAVHHGQADAIDVGIMISPQEVHLAIRDDGVGPGNGSAGLGSRQLDTAAIEWSLSAAEPGSILEVRLHLSPSPARSN